MIDAIQGPGQLVRLTVPARANSTTRTCSGSRDREFENDNSQADNSQASYEYDGGYWDNHYCDYQ